jgi:regulator of replication initiation timing
LKSAYELVRDLRKSNDPAVLKAGVEELTDRLLAAREDALRIVEELEILKEENARLKAQLAKADDFAETAKKYVRRQTGAGGFVYVETELQNEQSPNYCANCFDSKKLSILQPTVVHRVVRCPACEATTKV